MDVESLAKQLILQNMSPEQQTAVLDGIKASLAQAKDVQKRKIGENVQVVVETLKKLEADIKARYDETGKALDKRVASIKDGKDGKNGQDGRNGKDGRPGRDGTAGAQGQSGQDGANGRDGEDGISISDAHIDFDGSLIITLSDGRVLNVGEVVSQDIAEKIKVISTMSTNGAVAVKEEGTTITSGVKSINFVGAGITATTSGDDVTVTVASGSGTVTSVAATVPAFLSVAGSPITTSGTLAISLSGTALPVANGGTGVTTSTGTTNVVLSNSPVLVTPDLGTPSALVGTNITGTATAFTSSNVTTNANLTGDVTSVGNASTLATVNSNVGAFTNANITVNAKGLITAAASGSPGGVTSVTGTSPVVSSGGTTPAISLAAGYGDTLNPYASKTANFVLAAPNGSAGVPTFRALTTADIPALSYVTSVALSLPSIIAVTGSPVTTSGTLTGTLTTQAANAIFAGPLSGAGAAPTFRALTTADIPAMGATITNDTTTSSNVYPLFAGATSGSLTTVYTGDAKYLYKPSTGELTATAHISTNGIQINANTIATSYTIATGNNGLSAGPVSVSTGVTVTVSTGSTWTVV